MEPKHWIELKKTFRLEQFLKPKTVNENIWLEFLLPK